MNFIPIRLKLLSVTLRTNKPIRATDFDVVDDKKSRLKESKILPDPMDHRAPVPLISVLLALSRTSAKVQNQRLLQRG